MAQYAAEREQQLARAGYSANTLQPVHTLIQWKDRYIRQANADRLTTVLKENNGYLFTPQDDSQHDVLIAIPLSEREQVFTVDITDSRLTRNELGTLAQVAGVGLGS